MATTKKRAVEKLTKADPLFYQKIGAKGGKSTLKKLGKKHFKNAAILSHRNREPSTKPERGEEAKVPPVKARGSR